MPFDLRRWLEGRGNTPPAVMGILNVTPDSFSDGGLYRQRVAAVRHGLEMAAAGAEMVDVGGESTRPSGYGLAEIVPVEEEIRRTAPVIEELAKRITIPISIDTRKATVARLAFESGASIVNDVTALHFDAAMAGTASAAGAGVILMHMLGTDPRTMQDRPAYADLIGDVRRHLADAVRQAQESGVAASQIAVDPGLGFGKTAGDNLRLLTHIGDFRRLGYPVVIGASRKRFVGKFSGVGENSVPEERLSGSLACAAVAAREGAAIVRVHDVAATVRFLAATAAGATWPEAAREAGGPTVPFEQMLQALAQIPAQPGG